MTFTLIFLLLLCTQFFTVSAEREIERRKKVAICISVSEHNVLCKSNGDGDPGKNECFKARLKVASLGRFMKYARLM